MMNFNENKASILVVDDECAIADLIELYLKSEYYNVYKFYSPIEALDCSENETIDVAIIDIMMPEMDGFTLCEKIRQNHNFPIIMLTAKDQDIDKITGLTLGADDYMTKPFKPLELVARVKAQLRRYTKYNTGNPLLFNSIDIGGLSLDKSTHQCTLDEKILSLTPTEFSILWTLCEQKGQVISSEDLFQKVWGEKYFSNSNNTLMVHIRHLREKMNDSVENPKYIKTVWGVGYKIENR